VIYLLFSELETCYYHKKNYLPTEKAVRGGHYSVIAPSCYVGPEGGQVLVEPTVEEINKLWNAKDNCHAAN